MGSSRAASWVDATVPRWTNLACSMTGAKLATVQIHRAIVLIALMLVGVGALVLLLSDASGQSLIALAVVVLVALAGGIGFSWKRYYRR